MDTNVVTLSGRLTADCVLKYTSGGTAVLSGSIAVGERVKRGDQWQNTASFFEFAVFGKLGEGLKPYATKGRQVVISGRLKQERWTAQDRTARNRVTVIVDNFQLVGGNSQGNTQTVQLVGGNSQGNTQTRLFQSVGGNSQGNTQTVQYQQQEQYNPYSGADLEDIPF